MSQLTNILVVDDHAVVRQGIINVLLSIETITQCDEAENGNQALIKLDEGHYDIVFLDIQMSGMDGIETARHIKMRYKNTKVIMCSAFKEKGQIIALMQLGVEGYILKSADKHEINKALTHIALNNRYLSPEVDEIWQSHKTAIAQLKDKRKPTPIIFTAREKEIIKLLCKGDSAKQIADRLSVSYNTIKNHRSNIMKKMEAHNMVDMMNYVRENAVIVL